MSNPTPPSVPDTPGTLFRVAVVVAVLRYAIPLAAVPAIPWLLTRNIALLVLLRPQKEFLLLGGGQSRYLGEPDIWLLLAAYIPLSVLPIAAFYLVGQRYQHVIGTDDAPRWLTRILPPQQIDLGVRIMARKGPLIAILGRLAALPPTMLAAAAGLAATPMRRFLLADAFGAFVAFVLVVSVGWALGRAYADGAMWLTFAGVALFVAMLTALTSWLRAEANRPDPTTTT
jgi:membrane protein DedA with SNARE-associated domain